MNKNYFFKREYCPSCHSKEYSELLNLSYEDEQVQSYLKEFYGSQGKIELEYLEGVEYILSKCNNCAMIFQVYIPNDFLMGKLYEEWIDPSFIKQESFTRSMSYHRKNALEIIDVIKFFRKDPHKLKFMDFGMGWSEWARMSKSFGVDTYGMELSKERIHHAQKHLINIVEWEEVPSFNFDFINTEQVVEHLAFPLETIHHLSKGLRKGGLLKISVPNGRIAERNIQLLDWKQQRDSNWSMHVVTPLEHINCFTTESIIQIANQSGLKPISVRQEHFSNHISFKDFFKLKFGPFYRKIKKPTIMDTSLFFEKV